MFPLQRLASRSVRTNTVISVRSLNGVRTQHHSRGYSTQNVVASELVSKGLYKEALPLYTVLAQQNPGNAEYLANKAICLAGHPDSAAEAEAVAAKAVSVSGSDPKILVKQAHVLREVGKAELAVKILDGVSRFLGNDVDWNFELGKSLNFNWARYGPAIMHFDKALELNPHHVDSMYWRGMALHWSGRGDGFAWLTDANIAGDARESFFKGLKSFREGNYQAALEHFENSTVGLRPHDDSDVWSWRGEAHLALGNLDKALDSFNMALSLNAKDALSMHGIGEVYAKKGDKKSYEEWLTKAITTDRLYHKSDYFRQKVPIVPIA
eukprot:TRINITY_DN161_c0_g1_i1.p1 TRINITY_DN161_c0_g1~~TRINITY_DN161_c0_g1_i1.p1  ORF type:complete len:324 (+),score=72.76 TRINITY_DN161_c0_g1_i1:29-1000(+)